MHVQLVARIVRDHNMQCATSLTAAHRSLFRIIHLRNVLRHRSIIT